MSHALKQHFLPAKNTSAEKRQRVDALHSICNHCDLSLTFLQFFSSHCLMFSKFDIVSDDSKKRTFGLPQFLVKAEFAIFSDVAVVLAFVRFTSIDFEHLCKLLYTLCTLHTVLPVSPYLKIFDGSASIARRHTQRRAGSQTSREREIAFSQSLARSTEKKAGKTTLTAFTALTAFTVHCMQRCGLCLANSRCVCQQQFTLVNVTKPASRKNKWNLHSW